MGRKHRHWSVSEKRRIVAEANQPGTTKAAVARRHGISDSQLYAWRKVLGSETHGGFLSVITDATSPNPEDGSSSSIAIVLANGHLWVRWPVAEILNEHANSLAKEPPIKPGTPDPYVPKKSQ